MLKRIWQYPTSPLTRILIRKHQFEVECSNLIITSSSLAPEIVSSAGGKEKMKGKIKASQRTKGKRASLQVNKCLVASSNGRGAPNSMRNREVNKSETLTSQGRVEGRRGVRKVVRNTCFCFSVFGCCECQNYLH